MRRVAPLEEWPQFSHSERRKIGSLQDRLDHIRKRLAWPDSKLPTHIYHTLKQEEAALAWALQVLSELENEDEIER